MQLLPEEQKRLNLIDGALRAEAPTLASKSPPEKQFRADGAWRYKAFARQRARRYCYAVLALALVALVLILTLELA